jgi:hypothetical protein
MSKKLCFDKNIFVSGIIIIIIIIIILSVIFNYKYNKLDDAERIHNLINKKILNIKDKIIHKKQQEKLELETESKLESSIKYTYKPELELESELEPELEIEPESEPVIKLERVYKDNNIYKQQQQNYEYKEEKKQELEEKLEHKSKYKQELEEELEHKSKYKQELEQELEQEFVINNKKNLKNNINDRLNDRDELIKYKINDEVQQRDLNVLLNPIYPPLARVERPIFDNLIKMNFQQSTRGSEDTFRLMGYLINSNKNDTDKGGDIWKLFGRQTYKGSSIGEFYVSPVNDHQSDMKIFLKNDMMPKEKIKDIYALPSEVYLNSPFFSKNAYTINELPKSDFNSNYL